jgi:hypothetical protein|tara:strand:- start:456 stop:785 length:330 start_codon:yes stop_codon:yes gene_type:complete
MTINFGNTWRPLPPTVTVKESDIDGLGLFAKTNIPAGTDLGIIRILYHDSWIRTPLGGFPNHSDTPSCVNHEGINDHGDRFFTIETLRDLTPGEELTLSYQMPEYHSAS